MKLYAVRAPNRFDLYWRPERCGYTTDLSDIGIYSEEESAVIVQGGRGDTRVLLSDLVPRLIELRKANRESADRITMMLRQHSGLKGSKNA